MSKKWMVIVKFKTNNKADQEYIEEVAADMRWQLETLEGEDGVKVKAPITVEVIES